MSFKFKGTLEAMARQIGNAVPVSLARRFALTLARHLEEARTSAAAA
jgi:site-specific DNA-cytosine methylase